MACQKGCKQGRDDAWNWNSIDSVVVVPSMYKLIVITYNCQLEPDEGPATLRTSLCEADFLGFSVTCITTGNWLTLALLQLRVAICKQLNTFTAPYLGGMHSISLGHYYGRDCVSCTLRWSTRRFHVCTSLAPRPTTVVFGLGTRLRVHMHTVFKNGVLRNKQQFCEELYWPGWIWSYEDAVWSYSSALW